MLFANLELDNTKDVGPCPRPLPASLRMQLLYCTVLYCAVPGRGLESTLLDKNKSLAVCLDFGVIGTNPGSSAALRCKSQQSTNALDYFIIATLSQGDSLVLNAQTI